MYFYGKALLVKPTWRPYIMAECKANLPYPDRRTPKARGHRRRSAGRDREGAHSRYRSTLRFGRETIGKGRVTGAGVS
jgi:hypothetical protein